MMQWYLNLSLWEAVLVWLKLLLPVLWVLLVAVLVSMACRWFVGEMTTLPRPKLPNPKPAIVRKPKSDKPTVA